MKAYEIAEKWLFLAQAIDEAETDEERDSRIKQLATAETDLNEKFCTMAALIKNFEMEGEALEAESKRLKERAESRYKRAAGLRQYVDHLLMGSPWKDTIHAFTYRKSEAVEAEEPELMNEEFLRSLPAECVREVPAKVQPDLVGIKRVLKEGARVPGFKLVTRHNLQVK